jgi:hypothetical protein
MLFADEGADDRTAVGISCARRVDTVGEVGKAMSPWPALSSAAFGRPCWSTVDRRSALFEARPEVPASTERVGAVVRCAGLKRLRCAQVVCSGHAFVQNLRHGHYELGLDTESGRRLETIFSALAVAI